MTHDSATIKGLACAAVAALLATSGSAVSAAEPFARHDGRKDARPERSTDCVA